MTDPVAPDSTDRALLIDRLQAENTQLRAALAKAGIDALDVSDRQRDRDVEHGNELAAARRDTSEARADTRLMRADLAASVLAVNDLKDVRDALLVSEERLTLAFEASGSIGWWDWDIPGDRLYASAYFAKMYGVDPDQAAKGAPLSAFVDGIHPLDRQWVGERIRHAVETAGEFAEEYRLTPSEGEVMWIYARGRCYHDSDGRPLRYPGVAIDITARKRAEAALAQSEAQLLSIMEAVPVGLMVAEAPSGRIVSGNRKLTEILGHGTRFAATSGEYDAFIAYDEDGRLVNPSHYPLARICSGECDRATIEVHYQRPDGKRIWIEVVGEAIKDPQGRTLGGIVAVSDVSERRAVDARRDLMNQELAHRLKNTLAVVQSIATQTLRTAPDLVTARTSLFQRIQALSKAHDILLAGRRDAGAVETIIRNAVALHDPDGRIRLRGEDLKIGPKAALTLSLIMHELATNTVKYGALSVPQGVVHVAWVVATDDATQGPTLTLSWHEMNGPPVIAPTRKGFGTRLIEMGLSGSYGGSAVLDYAPDGLRYRLSASLTELQADDDA